MEKKGKKCPAHQIARKKNSWWPEITHPSPQELNGRPLKDIRAKIWFPYGKRLLANNMTGQADVRLCKLGGG